MWSCRVVSLSVNTKYDFDWLLKSVNYIQLWAQIFPEENENVLFLTYQDLSKDFSTLIHQVSDFFEHEASMITNCALQKQIHPLKTQFFKGLNVISNK